MAYQNMEEELRGIPPQKRVPVSDPQGVHTADHYGRPLGPPPVYEEETHKPEKYITKPKWWDLKAWGWKKWTLLGATVVVLVVVIIVGAVIATRNARYPNYSKLTYTLADTCV